MKAAIRLLLVFGALVVSLPALSGEQPRAPASAPSGVPSLTVIPRPAQVEASTGRPFALTAGVRVRAVGEVTKELVERAVEAVRAFTGVTLKPGEGPAGLGEVVLRLEPSVGRGRPEWQAKESYRLAVAPDGSGVEIAAADPHGLFNGIQTLAQLARQGEDPPGRVPALKIEDWPRFVWRGVMLDCSRTFQSVECLKKTNLYVLKVAQVKPQARYELRARVRSEGGTDSYGEVYLRRLERPK
jgi:N-acetyl-beta-hexosaminidase